VQAVEGELAAPIQWLASWRQQQQDIAVQKAWDRLGRQPGWAQAQLQLIQADENRVRSIASGSANPWQVGVSHYKALAEAWLGLVTDSQSAQDFYTLLPVIVESMYRQCFQGATPETFRPASADEHQFQADLAALDRDFRKRAAERALPGGMVPGVEAPKVIDGPLTKSPGRKSGRPVILVDGERIKELRGEYSQAVFARLCRVSVDAVQRAERHGRSSDKTIRRIVRKLKGQGQKIEVKDLMKNPPQ
jgi:hypothetical protein